MGYEPYLPEKKEPDRPILMGQEEIFMNHLWGFKNEEYKDGWRYKELVNEGEKFGYNQKQFMNTVNSLVTKGFIRLSKTSPYRYQIQITKSQYALLHLKIKVLRKQVVARLVEQYRVKRYKKTKKQLKEQFSSLRERIKQYRNS